MYPYNLSLNPYPSSPTPTLRDAVILGGKRHKEARDAIYACIDDMKSKVREKDFRLITVIQDVGSGKTHLALHIKATRRDIACSYVDLSTLFPRSLDNLYNAIIQGFGDDHMRELKKVIIDHIKEKAFKNDKAAKKFLRVSLFNRNIDRLANDILAGSRDPDLIYINDIFNEYDTHEKAFIKNIFSNTNKIERLEDILANLSALAKLNLNFLKKITMIEMDELDDDKDATDFIKAIINAHIPSTIMLLITTPSLYSKIRDANPSLFDRIEKANYKIDLAGSSMFDEIADIVLEYMRANLKDVTLTQYEADIIANIRVIYDEFREFRNIRSMLNIMYHTLETAKKKNANLITEDVIDETINHAYPGLRVKGSIMNVPISEFIKIRREYTSDERLENRVKDAIKSLVMFTHEKGKILPEGFDMENNLDVVYTNEQGKKIGIVVTINRDHIKIFEKINSLKKDGLDKLLILTNANTVSKNENTIVNLDKCKMVDLIYFSNKYKQEDIEEADTDRALVLARSVLLC